MTIRFQCGFCTQPIEVDDEWASKTVACPYCRKTITAPHESTLTDLNQVPTATPLAGASEPSACSLPAPGDAVAEPAPSAPPPNVVALVAFALACVMLLLAGCWLILLGSHGAEFAELGEPGRSFSEQTEALTKFADAHGGTFPSWFLAFYLLIPGIGACWVAALVCGIFGVRFPRRRSFAIAALMMVGSVPILACCGSGFVLAPYY